jgi:hypothetical protein
MIAGNESALRGGWRLLAFREDAFASFDVTPDGFRRSWLALALSLPFILLGNAVVSKFTELGAPLFAVAIFAVLNWLVGVGALVFFGILTRRSEALTATITMFNWFALWANILFMLPKLLLAAGLPLTAASALMQVMLYYFAAVQAFILWRLWRVHLLIVAGIVMAMFAVDIVTSNLFTQMIKPIEKSKPVDSPFVRKA